jgi:UDP:flavonoid glycosyltransferase YjiC (YdhE family)
MSVFVLAWELGGHLGHAMPLARLAQALLDRGHEVHLVWRDLSLATEVLGEHLNSPRLHLWQAPVWLARGPAAPATYAELLFTAGYAEPQRLRGLATAWRALLRRVRPAVMLADHAPTALLAARGLPIQRVPFGSGFMVPPACRPLPLLRDWEAIGPDRIEASEAQALAACNQVLASWGEAPMPALCSLFDATETFLMGWPELDHAGAARDPTRQRHWGHLGTERKGLVPAWPSLDAPRILAYLRSSHPAIEAVLATLRAGPWSSLVCLPGCTPDRAAQLESPSLRVLPELLDQSALLPEAALYLSHANFSSCHAALAAGVPCVMLPEQVEQMWFARRLAETGAGVWLWPQEAAAGLGRALDAVLGSPGFRRSAAALARRHAHQGSAQVLDALCERCEQLAAEAGADPAA